MAAYVIANISVNDAEGFATYVSQVTEVIERYGGRYIVRGGDVEILEGDPQISRLVIVEFPSMQQLRDFYQSADYQPILQVRKACADSEVLCVDGVA